MELLELLVRLIASLAKNRAANQLQARRLAAGVSAVPPQNARVQPGNRAPVAKKVTPARRAVRRPLPSVAVAKPILTKLQPLPAVVASQSPAIVRTRAAKPIEPANTIAPQSAAAIRKWLTPATLKQQFLLTEILQSPLALRDVPTARADQEREMP